MRRQADSPHVVLGATLAVFKSGEDAAVSSSTTLPPRRNPPEFELREDSSNISNEWFPGTMLVVSH